MVNADDICEIQRRKQADRSRKYYQTHIETERERDANRRALRRAELAAAKHYATTGVLLPIGTNSGNITAINQRSGSGGNGVAASSNPTNILIKSSIVINNPQPQPEQCQVMIYQSNG
jgi:hypothetical protein